MKRFMGALATYPARALAGWYGILVVSGTLLLLLPACRAADTSPMSFSDGLFTAASAACVTGLVVRDVTEFSALGQGVILALIQLGGIGIMTVATLVVVQLTGRQTLRQLVLARESLGVGLHEDLGRVLVRVISVTVIFELIGAVVLAGYRVSDLSLPQAAWWGLFHSVSAFCNAGFALSPDNLAPWVDSTLVNLTVIGLVVLGGLGFPVLVDLFSRRRSRPLRWRELHFHSQLVITASAALLLIGTLAILALEYSNAFAGQGLAQSTMTAFFHSASARTAGFSTLDIAGFSNATLFVLILLMWVGGGPGSAAGGIKVTTIAVLVLYGYGRMRGRQEIGLFRHRISTHSVGTAAVVVIAGITLIVTSLVFMLMAEQSGIPHNGGADFLDITFETFSAFSTVGLSMGITPELGELGRLITVLTMYVGRIGPLIAFTLLSRRPHGPAIRHPEAEIQIG
jgi:trk system potassium uptake protein TrkH